MKENRRRRHHWWRTDGNDFHRSFNHKTNGKTRRFQRDLRLSFLFYTCYRKELSKSYILFFISSIISFEYLWFMHLEQRLLKSYWFLSGILSLMPSPPPIHPCRFLWISAAVLEQSYTIQGEIHVQSKPLAASGYVILGE